MVLITIVMGVYKPTYNWGGQIVYIIYLFHSISCYFWFCADRDPEKVASSHFTDCFNDFRAFLYFVGPQAMDDLGVEKQLLEIRESHVTICHACPICLLRKKLLNHWHVSPFSRQGQPDQGGYEC